MRITDATLRPDAERAILLGFQIHSEGDSEAGAEASLAELEELCEACGIKVLAKDMQRRSRIDPASYAGSGKLTELREMAEAMEADCLVLNCQLSGAQMKNIAEITELKVLDRTLVILDIFARRAKSAEGALQVELAQLEDRLARLSGSGQALSRLGGGIGTRGPGESQLETDRRHIRRRTAALRRRLKNLEERRERARGQRLRREAWTFAVCGYTNAGKSSLINLLCQSELEAMDQVFATLDPGLRRLPGPGPEILLCDTVGFIRDLPHELVEAFHSTLDEVREADFILQITDLSDPEAGKQVELVDAMLRDLGVENKPRIHVLNKIDLLPESGWRRRFYRGREDAGIREIVISVKKELHIDELREAIRHLILENMERRSLLLSYNETDRLAHLRETAWIESERYEEDGIHLLVYLPGHRAEALLRHQR